MPYTLPPLAYAYNALEPHIDARTMEIHHTKHHQTYVNNLNAALEGTPYADLPLEDLVAQVETLPEKLRAPVRNNGGGHANHSLFWRVMSPQRAAARRAATWPAPSTPTWAVSTPSRPRSRRRRSRASAAAGPGSRWTRRASWPWKAAPTRTAH